MGLAIVKHIAQAHKGSVTVDSQLGKGSIFSVNIPIEKSKLENLLLNFKQLKRKRSHKRLALGINRVYYKRDNAGKNWRYRGPGLSYLGTRLASYFKQLAVFLDWVSEH